MPTPKNNSFSEQALPDDFRFELMDSIPRSASIKICSIGGGSFCPPAVYGADWIVVDTQTNTLIEYAWDEATSSNMANNPVLIDDADLSICLEGADLAIVLCTPDDRGQMNLAREVANACNDQNISLKIAGLVGHDECAVRNSNATDETHALAELFDCHLISQSIEDKIVSISAIVELITNNTMIGVDFNDVKEVLTNAGPLHVGKGRASGERRALASAEKAIQQLPSSSTVHRALMVIKGMNMTLEEWSAASSLLEKKCEESGIFVPGAVLGLESSEILETIIFISSEPYIGRRSEPHTDMHNSSDRTEATEATEATDADLDPRVSATQIRERGLNNMTLHNQGIFLCF